MVQKVFSRINVAETKETIIDLSRTAPSLKLTAVEEGEIDLVENHKDLRIVFDNMLGFQANSDAFSNTVQRRLYFLRKINSFHICTKMMTFFFFF